MRYEAPDFVKVVTNINGSFTSSPTNCQRSVGFLHVQGEHFGNTDYYCGGSEVWTDTDFYYNCWNGNVE